MPGTHSQILLHHVFSTEHREPWITADITARLYPYMGGIVRAEKGVLYGIGGPFLRPSGAGSSRHTLSTGSAPPAFRRATLHPWLHSAAPLEPKNPDLRAAP